MEFTCQQLLTTQPLLARLAHAPSCVHAQMINRLLYRSRQRGFLELDLLVGLWAEQEVPKMDLPMLQQFSVVLDQASALHTPHFRAYGNEPNSGLQQQTWAVHRECGACLCFTRQRQTLAPGGFTCHPCHAPPCAVAAQENPDLFKWLTGQQEAPSQLQANPAYTVGPATSCVCTHATVSRSPSCQQSKLPSRGEPHQQRLLLLTRTPSSHTAHHGWRCLPYTCRP